LVYDGSAARCARGGVRAMPARGCAFWQREPGADDEPDRVAEQARLAVEAEAEMERILGPVTPPEPTPNAQVVRLAQ
jgi:hypothetical protein